MKKRVFKTLLSFCLAASLCLPTLPVSAAGAKDVLTQKAEKMSLQDARDKGELAIYGLYDINKDGTVELFYLTTNFSGKRTTLKVYGYGSKKTTLVQTFQNVQAAKSYQKTILIKTIKNKITTYSAYTYKSKKLTRKSYYSYNSKKKLYTKNGKKIKKSEYTKYRKWFDARKALPIEKYSEEAMKIVQMPYYEETLNTWYLPDASLNGVMSNGNEVASYKVTLMRYDKDGQAQIEDSITCDRNTTPERTTIGKFDITKLALLDTEEFYDYESTLLDGADFVFVTSLRPSNAPFVLPSYEFPDNADVQGYDLIGKYTISGATFHLSRADFYFGKKGEEPKLFASYFFDRLPYDGFEAPILYEIEGFSFTEEPIHWNKNDKVEDQLDLTWTEVPGATSYIIKYCIDEKADYAKCTYKTVRTTENKVSLQAEKGKSFYLELWAELEVNGVSMRYCINLGEKRGYENLYDETE